MPAYTFKCKVCGNRTDATSHDAEIRCCGQPMTRVFNFNIGRGFDEHYNNSLGMYVSNKRIMDDAFKVASDSASLYTGIDHNFVYHDAQDHAAFGLKDTDVQEGKEYFERIKRDGVPAKATPSIESLDA